MLYTAEPKKHSVRNSVIFGALITGAFLVGVGTRKPTQVAYQTVTLHDGVACDPPKPVKHHSFFHHHAPEKVVIVPKTVVTPKEPARFALANVEPPSAPPPVVKQAVKPTLPVAINPENLIAQAKSKVVDPAPAVEPPATPQSFGFKAPQFQDPNVAQGGQFQTGQNEILIYQRRYPGGYWNNGDYYDERGTCVFHGRHDNKGHHGGERPPERPPGIHAPRPTPRPVHGGGGGHHGGGGHGGGGHGGHR